MKRIFNLFYFMYLYSLKIKKLKCVGNALKEHSYCRYFRFQFMVNGLFPSSINSFLRHLFWILFDFPFKFNSWHLKLKCQMHICMRTFTRKSFNISWIGNCIKMSSIIAKLFIAFFFIFLMSLRGWLM